MSFKIIADTFSVARDSSHLIQLKTLKKPRSNDQVWLAFEIIGDTKFARSTMQNITETFEEVFFNETDINAYERFENTLKEINITYKNLKDKRGTKSVGMISALIAVFSGNELHLTQSQDAEAYLVRRGKLSLISEGLSAKSDDLFVNIASGELIPEDKILLSTSRLLRLITQSRLAKMCEDGVTETLDSIRELVLADNDLSIGAACIHLKLQRSKTTTNNKNNFYLEAGKEFIGKVLGLLANKMNHIKLKFSKNTILAVILSIVLLLIISISLLMENKHNTQLRDEYRSRIEELNQNVRTASTKGYANDKETANNILDKTKKEARIILETKYFRAEAMALLDKIQETRDSINNVTRLGSMTPYVNLSSKRENIEALGLINMNDNFFAYEYNALYEVILDQVLDPRTIDETEVVMAGTAMVDQGILNFLTQSGRIIEYDDGQFSFANTNDENWKSGIDIKAYGKYLYMLSPLDNQIYKYSRLRSKYSGATEYNLDANLSDSISFAIDGNIYILKKGGEIIKLFKSKQQQFEIEDMATDISSASKIFTTPELNNLYILDSANKKVVIIEKDIGTGGRYREQMFFEELDSIEDIYVDKKEDKIFLLTKKAIYQAEI